MFKQRSQVAECVVGGVRKIDSVSPEQCHTAVSNPGLGRGGHEGSKAGVWFGEVEEQQISGDCV